MKPLDDELRTLFKRKDPSEGFTERVLARLEIAPPRLTLAHRISALLRRPVVRWVAVPVACTLVVLGVIQYRHEQRMQAQAEQASREAILALRITNAEIDAALERAQRITTQSLKAPGKSKPETE